MVYAFLICLIAGNTAIRYNTSYKRFVDRLLIPYYGKLEYPVKITKPDPWAAKVIISQYGGPDGELGAAIRYLSQKYSMVTPEAKAVLNDIGTEEWG